MNIVNPQPSGAKAGTGGFTVDISQIIRNFTEAETDDNKKSVLQKLLEPKEIDDSEQEAKKALQIAKKIARGDSVTPEEKQFLMRVNPQLAQMAELARKEGQRIKSALQQASSKEEQQTIVQQAYQQVSEVTKSNPQFGMLLGEAVKAAIQEAQKDPKCQDKPETEEDAKRTGIQNPIGQPEGGQASSPAASLPPEESAQMEQQDEILEQFYPEERVSMLDCKG
ncbi:hypothetical protein V1226_03540 [Lachnospiraceae bacterium JLR.KK009]